MERSDEAIAAENNAVLNKLCKWRSIYAGWQLGTRLKGDAESDAVRDHREVTILLRAEASALVGILIDKGVFTAAEFTEKVTEEARHLDAAYAQRFPGIESTDYGIAITDPARAAETMKGWPE